MYTSQAGNRDPPTNRRNIMTKKNIITVDEAASIIRDETAINDSTKLRSKYARWQLEEELTVGDYFVAEMYATRAAALLGGEWTVYDFFENFSTKYRPVRRVS
jgi:hypothetical protein